MATAAVLDQVWLTRCPVPTASGIAYRQGLLAEEFGRRGVTVSELADADPKLARHHLDHGLPGLFREGGSIPALAARAAGAPTRLIGLTWIEERQVILVRPDSGITTPGDLAGRRAALPVPGPEPGAGVMRAMALQGFRGGLAIAELGLDAVEFVDVPDAREAQPDWTVNGPLARPWTGIDVLARGEVDAVYAKGPAALDHAAQVSAVIGIDLDAHDDPACRVNNGTPRPITVHAQTLDEHPWAVTLFLAQTLRAAAWAAEHRADVLRLLARDSAGSDPATAAVHRGDFHRHLAPDLSETRRQLLDRQKEFLVTHGFLRRDFSLADWIVSQPLDDARELVGAA